MSYRCEACASAARTVISRYSNTYAKKPKRLGIRELPLGRLKVVISTYSNILSSVNMINIDDVCVWECGRERPLRLFEVLARNRQSALGLCGRTSSRKNKHTECVQYLLDNDCPLPEVGDTNMESYTRFKITGIIHQQKKNTRKEKQLPFSNARNTRIYAERHIDMVPETAQN